jgi:hypothetical protein
MRAGKARTATVTNQAGGPGRTRGPSKTTKVNVVVGEVSASVGASGGHVR